MRSNGTLPGHVRYQGRRIDLKYHRLLSGSGLHPPNSLSALREVLDGGAEVIEFDVRALSDGFVLLHDATLERETTGSGPAATARSAAVRELRLRGWDDPPTLLDDVTAALARHTGTLKVQVDFKEAMPVSAELARRLLHALEPLRANAGLRIVVGCLGDWNLRLLRRFDPSLPVGLDFALYLDAPLMDEMPRLPVRVNVYGYLDDHPLGFAAVIPPAAYLQDRIESLCRLIPGPVEVYLRKEFIRAALADGVNPVTVVRESLGDVGVDGWTVNDGDPDFAADLRALLDAGVSQITTDTALQLATVLE
ncbi:MAG TPA: glycerophosphodiester phosphodiesterase family protein [bacterium]|nr:glycerophosphodiester phosphodiesterase family protein [bacterium]